MLDLTPFSLTRLSATKTTAASFETKEKLHADVERFLLTHEEGWTMTVGVLLLSNGDRQVLALECSKGAPPVLHGLAGRQRIGLSPEEGGDLSMELMQSRLDSWEPPLRPSKRKVDEEELDAGAGRSVREALESMGARFGTKQELLGESGRHRSFLYATFHPSAMEIPAVAYVLVRVLPLYHAHRSRG